MESKTVLVVDDDNAIRGLLVELLAEEGYQVYSAMNGQEAVQRARQVQPDCILMDLNMPVLDGVEAIRLLKRDPETRSIRIYAMSARSLIDANRGDLIVDGTLRKPFDLQTIVDAVSQNADPQRAT